MLRSTLLTTALFVAIASAQAPGRGISKTTMACNDPIPGKQFLEKYFPVATPGDECADDTCSCTGWEILQGRVYATTSSSDNLGAPAGNGFGMHLVNVSKSRTTGGMSVAEVEAQFTSKLGDMSTFDSFMDFNAMFYTTGLAAYKKAFEADGVGMFVTTWTYNSKTWTSLFIHVPNTQLVLELAQDTTLEGDYEHHTGARASSAAIERALAMVHPLETVSDTTVGAIISPLAVNRAVSVDTMALVEDFYVNGMGTTMVVNSTGGGKAPDFKEYKCFLWTGATVDLCYYSRDDSVTKGDFKVGDFEKMLNTVHQNIIVKYPYCTRDKWTDNHYAIDSFSADTSKIVEYIDAHSVPVYCEGTAPHYIIDPTGWGIQADLQFRSSPEACSNSVQNSGRNLLQHTNPACNDGTCA
jgi:hypothetical protein